MKRASLIERSYSASRSAAPSGATSDLASERRPLPPITLASSDVRRLDALLSTRVGLAYRAEARRLRGELHRAAVVPSTSVPRELVTMNSKVVYADAGAGECREATLVYPWRAREHAALPVLSPVGTALLGLRVGDVIAWTLDDHSVKVLRVVSLLYQPEAAGDWHL